MPSKIERLGNVSRGSGFGLTVSWLWGTLGVKHIEFRVWRLSAKCGDISPEREEDLAQVEAGALVKEIKCRFFRLSAQSGYKLVFSKNYVSAY